MKYIIVGVLNFLIAAYYLINVSFMFISTFPELNSLYSKMEVAQISPVAYVLAIVVLAISIGNVFFGIKLFSRKKEKFFKKGIISLIVGVVGSGILYALVVYISTIAPTTTALDSFK